MSKLNCIILYKPLIGSLLFSSNEKFIVVSAIPTNVSWIISSVISKFGSEFDAT